MAAEPPTKRGCGPLLLAGLEGPTLSARASMAVLRLKRVDRNGDGFRRDIRWYWSGNHGAEAPSTEAGEAGKRPFTGDSARG